MTKPTPLKLAVNDNPHHRRVLDGDLSVPGFAVTPVPLAAGEMYSRAFEDPELDVVEMSIGRYVLQHSKGECRFVALPYYFAREFPHASYYVAANSPLTRPSDIKGRVVGLSEYDHTGHTWARALLEDDYGVPPSAINWVVARRESDRPPIRHFFRPPSDVQLEYAPDEKYLSKMLLTGEIDVLINPKTPSCFSEHPDKVRRLFPNHEDVERDYFGRTGICPVLHVIGVRRELLGDHPDLGTSLVRALKSSIGSDRAIWKSPAGNDKAPVVSLHGLERDEVASLNTFLRHHHSQGMSNRGMTIEEFFSA